MIREVTIRDFQRHRYLRLRLHRRVTTIVGPSDVGKSAVLRGLTWVLTNRPRGKAFVRDGAVRAKVTVMIDRHRLSRERGKRNHYRLDRARFTAFGNDVPAEVASIVNCSALNFQNQHDAPFWFSLAPAEVSRQLNQIVDLGAIDTTLGNLATATRKARAAREVVEDRLIEARSARKEFRSVARAHEELCRVERLERRWTRAGDQCVALKGLLGEARRHRAVVRRLEGVQRNLGARVAAVERVAQRWSRAAWKLQQAVELYNSARTAGQAASRHRTVADTAQQKLGKELVRQCPLCGRSGSPPPHP